METPAIIALMVLLGLFAVVILFAIAVRGLIGAGVILAFAAEQGFIGIAAYVACWVFLLPIMLIASVVVGFLVPKESV